MTATAPGRTLLKVVGILLIVFGAIATLFALLAIVGGGALGIMAANSGSADPATGAVVIGGGILIVVGIIALVSGIFNLIGGILGVKNCDKPEKAGSCFVFGIIMVALQVLNLIAGLLSGGDSSAFASILSSLLGFVLPVLYLLGAYKNKKAAA